MNTEKYVFGSILQEIEWRDVCVDDSEMNVNIVYRANGVTGDSTVTMFCIKLPNGDLKEINENMPLEINSDLILW